MKAPDPELTAGLNYAIIQIQHLKFVQTRSTEMDSNDMPNRKRDPPSPDESFTILNITIYVQHLNVELPHQNQHLVI